MVVQVYMDNGAAVETNTKKGKKVKKTKEKRVEEVKVFAEMLVEPPTKKFIFTTLSPTSRSRSRRAFQDKIILSVAFQWFPKY